MHINYWWKYCTWNPPVVPFFSVDGTAVKLLPIQAGPAGHTMGIEEGSLWEPLVVEREEWVPGWKRLWHLLTSSSFLAPAQWGMSSIEYGEQRKRATTLLPFPESQKTDSEKKRTVGETPQGPGATAGGESWRRGYCLCRICCAVTRALQWIWCS